LESPENDARENRPGGRHGRRLALLLLLIALGAVVFFGGLMIKHRLDYAISDAVFVDCDRIVNLSLKKVGGRLTKMTRVTGDRVRRGELLAAIDERDYRLRKEGLEARLEALRNQRRQKELALQKGRRQLKLKIALAQDEAAGAKALIAARQSHIGALRATIAQLERDVARYRALYRDKVMPRHKFETIETELTTRRRELKALRRGLTGLEAQLRAARKKIALARTGELGLRERKKGIAAIQAQIRALQKQLDEARLEVSYCQVTSPIDGRIAKRYHSPGDVVGSGMPLYALVDPKDLHILVLLGEKKLAGVKPGCPAKITIDAYPDLEYRGEVSAILPTSAAKFALVPRDISAGEFTKVVQRIPVKVRITHGDLSQLRPGMGGEIEIKREP
jgi:membrane fusion protein (multidrug efflux system)